MGGGVPDHAVFTNLSAKPDGPGTRLNPTTGETQFACGNDDGPTNKEEVQPTYHSAPPYWEITVTLPGVHSGRYSLLGPGDMLVDGLPVGNLLGFSWNFLVSMGYELMGFLSTYPFYTTHAAKHGSRAGLGITLIQYGLYANTPGMEGTKGGTNATLISSTIPDPWGVFGPSSTSDWDGSIDRESKWAQRIPFDDVPFDVPSGAANEWLGYILIALGWFFLLSGLFHYWRVVRWVRAVQSDEIMVSTLA